MKSLPEIVVNGMPITDLLSALLINGCNNCLGEEALKRGIGKASDGFPSLRRRLFSKKQETSPLEAALQVLQRDYNLRFSPGSYVQLSDEMAALLEQQLQEKYGRGLLQQLGAFSQEVKRYAQ